LPKKDIAGQQLREVDGREEAGRFASVLGLCCTSLRRHWAVRGTDWIVGDPRERSEKVIELSRHGAVIVST
jgi:hypothetical protein